MPSAVGDRRDRRRTSGSWRTVTFEHVTIEVPAGWPVYNLTADPARCPRLDRHAVYLGRPGPDPSCPAGELTGKTEAVQLLPASAQSPDVRAATRAATIDGAAVRTNPDSAVTHTIIDILPAARVEVSLSYGTDLALIRRIQASIRVTGRVAVANGPAVLAPAGDPASEGAGHLPGPGLRHLRRAVGGHHEPLAQVAVPGDRHLHRRGQPRLRAGQPQRELAGRDPEPGLALLPVLRRAAGGLRGRIR